MSKVMESEVRFVVIKANNKVYNREFQMLDLSIQKTNADTR